MTVRSVANSQINNLGANILLPAGEEIHHEMGNTIAWVILKMWANYRYEVGETKSKHEVMTFKSMRLLKKKVTTLE